MNATRKLCPKCGYERTTEDDKNAPPEQCPNCGVIYDKVRNPSVGRRSGRSINSGPAPFSLINLGLSVSGAIFLMIGAFLPVFTVGGSTVTYFKGGDGDGILVVIAAAVILVGAVAKHRKMVGFAAIASLAVIAFGMLNLSRTLGDQRDGATNVIGRAIAETASMEWGWAVMIVGALMALSGAIVSKRWLQEQYGT